VIPLSYAPLVLHLTYLPRAFVSTLTLLVSSSDSNIRIYQPVLNNNGLFEEVTDQGVREKVRQGEERRPEQSDSSVPPNAITDNFSLLAIPAPP